jgi:hypothetical protein
VLGKMVEELAFKYFTIYLGHMLQALKLSLKYLSISLEWKKK